jgi:hypothetical protein
MDVKQSVRVQPGFKLAEDTYSPAVSSHEHGNKPLGAHKMWGITWPDKQHSLPYNK